VEKYMEKETFPRNLPVRKNKVVAAIEVTEAIEATEVLATIVEIVAIEVNVATEAIVEVAPMTVADRETESNYELKITNYGLTVTLS
jgi:hypothetical protein